MLPLLLALILSGCRTGGSAAVTLEWVTASEVDNAGFNLYRGESPDGPFAKVNQSLIPAGGSPITGGRYSYVDGQVLEGKTYWYRLEDIGLDGKSTLRDPLEVVARTDIWAGWLKWIGVVAGALIAGAVLVGAWRRRRKKL